MIILTISKSNDNSFSRLFSNLFQSEDEIQNFLNILSKIKSVWSNSLVNTIRNAEIFILPNIDSIELKECFASISTNSQPLCQIQNKT